MIAAFVILLDINSVYLLANVSSYYKCDFRLLYIQMRYSEIVSSS